MGEKLTITISREILTRNHELFSP